jgi:CRISPR-associated protein Csx10
LGQVEVYCAVETASSPEAARLQALQQRLDQLNTALQTRWQQVESLCEEPRSCPTVFTVNLRADAILKEYGWLPTTVLTAAMLSDITGVADESLHLLRSYVSYDYRGGWHTGQRLPKDTELVTRLGGVFVFQTDDLTPWLAPLAALEVHGIGKRTAEGFGEVRICDVFHVEGRERK